MSNYVISPNMSLPIPVVGQETGPDYATDVNNSLTLLDGHDHTPGRGVAITTSAININANLNFNATTAVGLAGLTLIPQTTAPGKNTLFESGVDLYYVDGNGTSIPITSLGGVAGTPGSIANLALPASASYVSGTSTFVWQSDVNIAANLDAGSLLLRNLSPNSTFALTLSPPAGLSSNYQIVLPTLPSSQKIVTLDNNGNMAAVYTVDGTTIAITSNAIGIAAGGVGTTQLANSSVTAAKLNINETLQRVEFTASSTWVCPAGITNVMLYGAGGGGGGGSSGAFSSRFAAGGGAGGAGANPSTMALDTVPGDTYTITIGGGGTGGTPSAGTGQPGAPGGTTMIQDGSGAYVQFFGGGGGNPGIFEVPAGAVVAGPSALTGPGIAVSGGSTTGGAAGAAGQGSQIAPTGAGGSGTDGGGGGGGGIGAGGAGGTTNTNGSSGSTSAGGGGGGGGSDNNSGGNGGSGFLAIIYGAVT